MLVFPTVQTCITLLDNTVVKGNVGDLLGVGIYNLGTLTLEGSTVDSNVNDQLARGNGGGGITSNFAMISYGGNIVGVRSLNCTIEGTSGAHDQSGTPAAPINAGLGMLGSNGGPTETNALSQTSPAINKGTGTTSDPSLATIFELSGNRSTRRQAAGSRPLRRWSL